MPASPLYRLTFTDGSTVELRGNAPVQRMTIQGRLSVCLARDVVMGDEVCQDYHTPGRTVASVLRLPARRPRANRKRRSRGEEA